MLLTLGFTKQLFLEIILKNCFISSNSIIFEMAENITNNSDDYKIRPKNESTNDKIFEKMSRFVGGTRGEKNGSSFDINSIIFGLFALIGFIILVYSIFVAVVGQPLALTADTLFVAALIGSFTLVGIIVSPLFLKK
jgi:hypothetical protein